MCEEEFRGIGGFRCHIPRQATPFGTTSHVLHVCSDCCKTYKEVVVFLNNHTIQPPPLPPKGRQS